MDSNEVRREWAERSGEHSPAYYAYYGPDETSEAVGDALERFVGRDAAVLELGCGSGRHLSHLADRGFSDLSGVELNEDALDVMEEHYPDLATVATLYLTAIEDVVTEFEDGQFDAVFSVETLQHLHRDAEWVFEELARITDDVLVTAEIEDDAADTRPTSSSPDEADADGVSGGVDYITGDVPLYHRDWRQVFTSMGFVQVDAEPCDRDTVRTFRLE